MIPFKNQEIANVINPKFLGISLVKIKAMLVSRLAIPSRIQSISAALVWLNAVVKVNNTNNKRDKESKIKKRLGRSALSIDSVGALAGKRVVKFFASSGLLRMRTRPTTKLPVNQITKRGSNCGCDQLLTELKRYL